MNRVSLIGRLTKDPELRYTSSNIASCSFTIAVNRTYTNQDGQREADFIPIVVWRKQAENVKNYTKKGDLVAVEGRIQTRNYVAQDNTKRYVTEVIADNVQFLTPKGGQSNMQQDVSYNQPEPAYTPDMPAMDIPEDPYADFGTSIELTDDLPF